MISELFQFLLRRLIAVTFTSHHTDFRESVMGPQVWVAVLINALQGIASTAFHRRKNEHLRS